MIAKSSAKSVCRFSQISGQSTERDELYRSAGGRTNARQRRRCHSNRKISLEELKEANRHVENCRKSKPASTIKP